MKINIIKFKKDDKNKMKGKIKRKEWLNLYSKGFFVESINNDYENQDIIINRTFKNKNNNLFNSIKKKNFNYIITIDSKEEKNISIKKNNLKILNGKNEEKYYFLNLKDLIQENNDSAKNKEKNYEKNITNKPKGKTIKTKKIKKYKSTININFINIEQNIIQKNQPKKIRSKKKEINNNIKSPLINYLNTQKLKYKNNFKIPLIKKINNIINERDNMNTCETNKEKQNIKNINLNLNLYQYINYNYNGNKRQINNFKKNYEKEKESKVELGELGDYSFDNDSINSERKNIIEFSDICNTTFNNIGIKEKMDLNIFLNKNNKKKDFKKNKIEEMKLILNELKK